MVGGLTQESQLHSHASIIEPRERASTAEPERLQDAMGA
jgi:hypothetical protein